MWEDMERIHRLVFQEILYGEEHDKKSLILCDGLRKEHVFGN
jgi:hypothetical protein